MSANAPEVQLLSDTGLTTIVKVTGYYTSACTAANTMVVNTAALSFANTSQSCLVSISRIQYSSDVAGIVQLYWEGSSNSPIVNFGTSQAGNFEAYITNNATAPTGNIGVQTINLAANDTYSFILTLNKEHGYANAFIGYNDNIYKP